jgi:hypothetical protein
MNANELADELEHYLKGEEYDRLVWEIPDMLRQQQAEIEALKAETINTIMAEHCTCYKLGYSQLNNFTKVD